MRVSRRFLLTSILGAVLAGLAVTAHLAQAEPPFPEGYLNGRSSWHLDFAPGRDLAPTVSREAAVREALSFLAAPASATVRSTRLAVFSGSPAGSVLVWVVDVDGLALEAPSGQLDREPATGPSTMTRSAVFVRAAGSGDPVVGGFSKR